MRVCRCRQSAGGKPKCRLNARPRSRPGRRCPSASPMTLLRAMLERMNMRQELADDFIQLAVALFKQSVTTQAFLAVAKRYFRVVRWLFRFRKRMAQVIGRLFAP